MQENGRLKNELENEPVPFSAPVFRSVPFSAPVFRSIKVAVGDRDAVSGSPWDEGLSAHPQNYLVCPDQDWLGGFSISDGFAGDPAVLPGCTAGARTDESAWYRRLRLVVYEPRAGRFPDHRPRAGSRARPGSRRHGVLNELARAADSIVSPRIQPDPYGVDAWDPSNHGTVDVYLVEQRMFQRITGDCSQVTTT